MTPYLSLFVLAATGFMYMAIFAADSLRPKWLRRLFGLVAVLLLAVILCITLLIVYTV